MRLELEKVQHSYTEALDRISALQIELEIQSMSCATCKTRLESRSVRSDTESSHELLVLREKLQQKSQLLEKAKVLLTRAAAKEKNFREQVN